MSLVGTRTNEFGTSSLFDLIMLLKSNVTEMELELTKIKGEIISKNQAWEKALVLDQVADDVVKKRRRQQQGHDF